MPESIIVALITGGVSLIGTIATVLITSNKTNQNLQISQAVTDTKIEGLTREVREHNVIARQIPVIEEKIKVINRRLNDLEKSKTED